MVQWEVSVRRWEGGPVAFPVFQGTLFAICHLQHLHPSLPHFTQHLISPSTHTHLASPSPHPAPHLSLHIHTHTHTHLASPPSTPPLLPPPLQILWRYNMDNSLMRIIFLANSPRGGPSHTVLVTDVPGMPYGTVAWFLKPVGPGHGGRRRNIGNVGSSTLL